MNLLYYSRILLFGSPTRNLRPVRSNEARALWLMIGWPGSAALASIFQAPSLGRQKLKRQRGWKCWLWWTILYNCTQNQSQPRILGAKFCHTKVDWQDWGDGCTWWNTTKASRVVSRPSRNTSVRPEMATPPIDVGRALRSCEASRPRAARSVAKVSNTWRVKPPSARRRRQPFLAPHTTPYNSSSPDL